jgi:deoxyribonuclease V
VRIANLHAWPRSTRAAIGLQKKLASQVRLCPVSDRVRHLGGADATFSPDGRRVIAGVVVWDLQTGELLESRTATRECTFPYVPGLLSFRELPGVLAALRKLQSTPDAILCDGQGLAHPRRFGLACHLGLWLGIPTVGCAKSRLSGTYDDPPPQRGAGSPLLLDGEPVGVVLRTRDNVQPVFVSPGHLCDHDSAVRLTLAAAVKYRLPEPIRLAHQLVTRARQWRDGVPRNRRSRAGGAPAATVGTPNLAR